MQPVVPKRNFSDVVAPYFSQPSGIAVQLGKDIPDVGTIERDGNQRVLPIELTLKLFAARRLANHHGSGCGSLVESGGNFIAAGGELGSVHIASVGEKEAAAFKQSCQ